jgi:hypothetical protein
MPINENENWTGQPPAGVVVDRRKVGDDGPPKSGLPGAPKPSGGRERPARR